MKSIMTALEDRQTRVLRIGICFALFCLLLPELGYAQDLIQCRYLKSQGKQIQLLLSIPPSPPASIIVIQHLPPGTVIVRSSPGISKYIKNRGEAKWLLKGVRAGSLKVNLELAQALAGNQIHGEIRYKDPATGKMVRMRITP